RESPSTRYAAHAIQLKLDRRDLRPPSRVRRSGDEIALGRVLCEGASTAPSHQEGYGCSQRASSSLWLSCQRTIKAWRTMMLSVSVISSHTVSLVLPRKPSWPNTLTPTSTIDVQRAQLAPLSSARPTSARMMPQINMIQPQPVTSKSK